MTHSRVRPGLTGPRSLRSEEMGTSARPRIKEVNAAAVAHVGVKMSKKYYTESIKPEDLHRSNSLAFMNPRKKQKTSKHKQTSKHETGPAHNQQVSRRSSTVGHDARATDEQA